MGSDCGSSFGEGVSFLRAGGVDGLALLSAFLFSFVGTGSPAIVILKIGGLKLRLSVLTAIVLSLVSSRISSLDGGLSEGVPDGHGLLGDTNLGVDLGTTAAAEPNYLGGKGSTSDHSHKAEGVAEGKGSVAINNDYNNNPEHLKIGVKEWERDRMAMSVNIFNKSVAFQPQ